MFTENKSHRLRWLLFNLDNVKLFFAYRKHVLTENMYLQQEIIVYELNRLVQVVCYIDTPE